MGMKMDTNKRMSVKLFAAIVGGSAVVAMGALGVAIGQQSAGQDVAAGGASVSVGPTTSIEPTGMVEESVDKAAPAITGTPAWPVGEVPNRIP